VDHRHGLHLTIGVVGGIGGQAERNPGHLGFPNGRRCSAFGESRGGVEGKGMTNGALLVAAWGEDDGIISSRRGEAGRAKSLGWTGLVRAGPAVADFGRSWPTGLRLWLRSAVGAGGFAWWASFCAGSA
jgi:hypothetical protein